MKIYDTHCDVFSNIYERLQKGEKDVFKKYHYDDMKKGEVVGGIWVVYSEYDFDAYKAYQMALKEFEPYKKDFDVVYGLEGLRNVKTIEEFQKFYDLGVRHAMLTWNEENHLATGVAGKKDHGLKEEGKVFLDFMNTHHMITDVSHLNVKSFYEVMETKPKVVIASHSDSFTLRDHRRNLSDDQLNVLKEAGGYVGINSAKNFISLNPLEQNVSHFVDHLIYIANRIGWDHVMLGLDMMNFLEGYGTESSDNLYDLPTHAEAQKIIEELIHRGISKDRIERIAYQNYLEMISKIR
jgi:membrane dipeptidase